MPIVKNKNEIRIAVQPEAIFRKNIFIIVMIQLEAMRESSNSVKSGTAESKKWAPLSANHVHPGSPPR